MKFMAWVFLSISFLGATPWMRVYSSRAMPYLTPGQHPMTLDGPSDMHWGKTDRFRSKFCWGLRDGVLCSACYDNDENYYAQVTVLCPWNKSLCRYVGTNDEVQKYKINLNQCLLP